MKHPAGRSLFSFGAAVKISFLRTNFVSLFCFFTFFFPGASFYKSDLKGFLSCVYDLKAGGEKNVAR